MKSREFSCKIIRRSTHPMSWWLSYRANDSNCWHGRRKAQISTPSRISGLKWKGIGQKSFRGTKRDCTLWCKSVGLLRAHVRFFFRKISQQILNNTVKYVIFIAFRILSQLIPITEDTIRRSHWSWRPHNSLLTRIDLIFIFFSLVVLLITTIKNSNQKCNFVFSFILVKRKI